MPDRDPVTVAELRAVVLQLAAEIGELRAQLEQLKASDTDATMPDQSTEGGPK